jgi:hypothetical protein
MANHISKDLLRREAYLLKQLQSLYAWRGSLVDSVIQKLIVPKIKFRNLPLEDEILGFSSKLMDKQIAFGKARKYRCPSATKSNENDAYCAFYDMEYGGGLNEEKLEEAKRDVMTSLKNLVHSDFLRKIMTNSFHIIAQRSLVFELGNIPVSCTPDMIVFFKDAPPLIVDWKVHSFGNADSWLQLGVYAVALSRTKPHRDFPVGIQNQLKNPTDIRLVEYQLLKNMRREYSITPEDIADIYDNIFRSWAEMNRLVNGKKYDELDITRFQTARSPRICERCQFKKLCWTNVPIQKVLWESS